MRIQHLLIGIIIVWLLIISAPAESEEQGMAASQLQEQSGEEGWYLQGEPVIKKDEEIDLPPCYTGRTVTVSNGKGHGSVTTSAECFRDRYGTFSSDVTWTPPPAYMKPGSEISFSMTFTSPEETPTSGLIGATDIGTIVEGDSRNPGGESAATYTVPDGSPGDEMVVYASFVVISGLHGYVDCNYKYQGGPELPSTAQPTEGNEPLPEPTEDKDSECVGCKGLCVEAIMRYLIPFDEAANYGSIQVDYEGLKADFEDAIDRYNRDEDNVKAFSSDNAIGALPALSWLQSQGGTVDWISEKFVFTKEEDMNARTITPKSVKGRGIERSLYWSIREYSEKNNGKKLTPGDVLFLALKERKGDVREALLLSHNLMRSLARENDAYFTGIPSELSYFDEYLQPMITSEPLGKGQNAGMWYHLFGTAYYEMQGRGEWGPVGLGEAMVGSVRKAIDGVVETLLYDPELKEPPNRAVISILANEIEQGYRLFKTDSAFDPEKYCINVYGAQLGAWLYGNKLKKQSSPKFSSPESIEIPSVNPIPSRRTLLQLCPVNVIWEGNGSRMELDQKSEDMSGFYPISIVPFFENESNSWGVLWTELNDDSYKVSFEAVEDGWHHLMIIDNESGIVTVYPVYMNAGDKSSIDIDPDGLETELIQGDGRIVEPVVIDSKELTETADESDGEILYNSWNTNTVDNGPTCSPFFTIDEPMTITYIDTFHWNYGEGAPGGTIGLRDGDGTVHGPWQAESSREGGEVPRGYWIAHPNEVIPAGSYTIEDSDPDTWSQNSESPCGLATVEGYAVDSTTPHESGIPAPETASAKGTSSRPPVASKTAEAGMDSSLGSSSMAEEELDDAGANPPATKKTISSSGKEIQEAAKPERPSIEVHAYPAPSDRFIEIRGQEATGDFEWTAQNFAGFYYDPNEDVGTEALTATLKDGKLSGSQPFGLYYQTTVQMQDFAFRDWGSYQCLGFLGEKYLAGYAQGSSSESSYLFDRSGDKSALAKGQLLKILADGDVGALGETTVTTDTPLQLEDGYELHIKSIDIDGDLVDLELTRDGTVVDTAKVSPSKDEATLADKTYLYKKDIGELKDFVVIAVHFKNAFRGADMDLATVNGLWQLCETPVYVAEGAEYDKMTVQSVTDDAITMANQGAEITLGRNKDVFIMPGMSIRTADADALRYYIYREITDPGTYEIRSTVETADYAAWTAAEFAGFYYDLDQDIVPEMLAVKITDGKLVEPDGIRYTTGATSADFKFEDWGSYDVIGFLGEKYFAGYIDGSDSGKGLLFEKSSNKSALAKEELLKVLVDDDSETTITSRSPLMLAEGYRLELKDVDDDGRVYANLLKGDKLVKDYMFQPSKDDATLSDKTCFFRDPSLGLVTIAVHFKNAFRGADQNLATIDGIWQISDSPISVSRGASFDKLTVFDVTDRSIVMNNIDRTITLSRDKNIALAGDIRLRTADTDSLRYYLAKEESPSGFSGIEGYAGASEDASLATSSNPMAPEVETNLEEAVSTPYTASASNSLDELIYSDDFSDMNSGWLRASNRPDLDAMGYDDGRYHIIRKRPGQSWSSPPDSQIFRDIAVEVEANQEEGPDDNQYGLVFRRDASGNYYCFQISGAGNYRFDVNFDGKWREIVPDTWSSKINTGKGENVLRVVCSGERFIFYANGAKIGEAQDSSIPSGRIGLVAGSLDDQRVHISFDNLKVWSL